MSHPSRVRGLKWVRNAGRGRRKMVAPFTGAWIEISPITYIRDNTDVVAPFTGAWIEIGAGTGAFVGGAVAPFTGAWIEITLER